MPPTNDDPRETRRHDRERRRLETSEKAPGKAGHCEHCGSKIVQPFTEDDTSGRKLKLRSLVTVLDLDNHQLQVKCPKCRKLSKIGVSIGRTI